MVERGDGLGFEAEPLQLGGRREPRRQQHLERDDAVQAELPRFVHRAHAAASEFANQFVIAEAARVGGLR